MAQRPMPEPEGPLTVSQLAAKIAGVIAANFKAKVRLIGEVSGFRERTHWYFDLKDTEAVVNCVMFAGAARKSRHTPANGAQVLVSGRVEYYEKLGRVTLIVEHVEPVGAGAIDQALRSLIEEARRLGWLDEARKRALPPFPRRIAVVTSRTGAALQDVIDTMRRRCPAVGVVLVDARVQGEGAAAEVAAAIRWLGRASDRLGVDAILVTRGGGSKEDLWAFNERIVAEAIVNSPIPVVAAIGHETDTTLAELVADLRCATPTQAAMRLTPDRAALAEQLDAMSSRLRNALIRDTREHRRRIETVTRMLRQTALGCTGRVAHTLERLARRLESHRPAAAQARRQASLATAQARLESAMRARVYAWDVEPVAARLARSVESLREGASLRLGSLERQLSAIGPASVLKRGFSYTMREDGTIVRSTKDARPGDRLRTTVADGVVQSIVEGGSEPAASRSPDSPTAATPRNRRPSSNRPGADRDAPGDDQMDLFKGGR